MLLYFQQEVILLLIFFRILVPWKTDTHIRKSHWYFTPKLSDLTAIVNACGSLWKRVKYIFGVNEMFFSAWWQVGRACWSSGRQCTSSSSSSSSGSSNTEAESRKRPARGGDGAKDRLYHYKAALTIINYSPHLENPQVFPNVFDVTWLTCCGHFCGHSYI